MIRGLLAKQPYAGDLTMTDAFVVTPEDGGLKNVETGKFLTRDPGKFWRESDTVGNYEQMRVNGLLAVFCPTPPDGQRYPEAFLYWPEVPNV